MKLELSRSRICSTIPSCLILLVLACDDGEHSAPGTQEVTEPAGPERSTTLHGHDIHYESYGEAQRGQPTLVLVHGWASSTWTWHRQLPGLLELGRVLVVDLPGHGKSAEIDADEEYTLDLFADAVAAVLDDAGVERAVIVGHSNGTPVAVRFYRSYPERTVALVAVDGALQHMFSVERVEGMVAPFRADDYLDIVKQMISGMAGDGLSDEDLRGIILMAINTPQRVMVDSVLATADPAMWSAEPIRVPLLALLVEQPTWNDDYRAAIEELAPQLDWVTWQDVSHFLMLERPTEFQAELSRFLAGIGQAS